MSITPPPVWAQNPWNGRRLVNPKSHSLNYSPTSKKVPSAIVNATPNTTSIGTTNE